MRPLPLRLAIVLFAALLAAPATSGAPAEEEEPSAYAAMDGVTYYMASGRVDGSALTHDAGAGEAPLDFQGCVLLMFRPEFGRGRVALDGVLDGVVPIKLEMSDFDGPDSVQANVTVDSAHDTALPPGGKARAEMAARGYAQMHAGIVPDDEGAPVLGNFTDPLTGEPDLHASVFATRDGMRGPDGALQPQVQSGDAEIHVVVESPPGAAPQPERLAFGPPAYFADGSAFPNAEHAATYAFLNSRYGGVATLTVTSTSKAPPGSNQVTVTVYAPDGFQAGNATVASSVLGQGSATLEVPLDQMGEYTVIASGSLLMGSYRIDVELAPPPAFKLDFWWEEADRGEAARAANSQCLKDLGLRAQVVSGNVLRNKPPLFPMELVVLAVLVSAATGLFLVKLAFETFSSAEFKRSFKK